MSLSNLARMVARPAANHVRTFSACVSTGACLRLRLAPPTA